jgi:hypothetical protein
MAEKSLVMTFLNEKGAKANITLPGIKEGLTAAEVSTAMDAVIAKNIFSSTGGDLKTKNSAQITERNVTDLDIK